MTPIELTKTEFIQRVGNFEESPKDWKYVGDKPCIVDFHAPWCGYCKRLEPKLDEFAKEYDGKKNWKLLSRSGRSRLCSSAAWTGIKK